MQKINVLFHNFLYLNNASQEKKESLHLILSIFSQCLHSISTICLTSSFSFSTCPSVLYICLSQHSRHYNALSPKFLLLWKIEKHVLWVAFNRSNLYVRIGRYRHRQKGHGAMVKPVAVWVHVSRSFFSDYPTSASLIRVSTFFHLFSFLLFFSTNARKILCLRWFLQEEWESLVERFTNVARRHGAPFQKTIIFILFPCKSHQPKFTSFYHYSHSFRMLKIKPHFVEFHFIHFADSLRPFF